MPVSMSLQFIAAATGYLPAGWQAYGIKARGEVIIVTAMREASGITCQLYFYRGEFVGRGRPPAGLATIMAAAEAMPPAPVTIDVFDSHFTFANGGAECRVDVPGGYFTVDADPIANRIYVLTDAGIHVVV